MEEILKFLVQAMMAFCGVYLAAELAIRRFRKEKWWQIKSEIYRELINELCELKYPKVRFFESLTEGSKIEEDEAQELIRREKDSQIRVSQIAERSSFFLKEDTLSEIRKMDQNLSRARQQESAIEQYQEEIHAVNKCIERVKVIGRADLRISKEA